MNCQELLKLLKDHRFYVFGTGFVADVFSNWLISKDLIGNVIGFTVSDPKNLKYFKGRPVIRIDDPALSRGYPVIAAVHPAVYETLDLSGKNAICIYPYLWELLYGPAASEGYLPVKTIRENQPEDQYWIALRYAAVKGIYDGDDHLKNMYLRGMSIHASKETAAVRLASLEKLLNDIEKSGFDQSAAVSITEDFDIIDGLHRFAIAAFLGMDAIRCRIYSNSEMPAELLGPENRLPERVLAENGFDRHEIEILRSFRKVCG